MKLVISIGRAIKQKTSNRPWLDYKGDGSFDDWHLEMHDVSDTFIYWLTEKFGERISKYDFLNKGQRVMVFSNPDDPSAYWFFRVDGKLANALFEGELSSLYDKYLREKRDGCRPFSQKTAGVSR